MSDAAISNCGVKCGERMQQNSKGDTNFKSWFDKKKKIYRKVKKWLLGEEILDNHKNIHIYIYISNAWKWLVVVIVAHIFLWFYGQ